MERICQHSAVYTNEIENQNYNQKLVTSVMLNNVLHNLSYMIYICLVGAFFT
jgi:hypothetical protein